MDGINEAPFYPVVDAQQIPVPVVDRVLLYAQEPAVIVQQFLQLSAVCLHAYIAVVQGTLRYTLLWYRLHTLQRIAVIQGTHLGTYSCGTWYYCSWEENSIVVECEGYRTWEENSRAVECQGD